MRALATRFVQDDAGQDLIEYVLLGSLIALVVLVGVGNLGTNINTWYDNVANWVDARAGEVPTE